GIGEDANVSIKRVSTAWERDWGNRNGRLARRLLQQGLNQRAPITLCKRGSVVVQSRGLEANFPAMIHPNDLRNGERLPARRVQIGANLIEGSAANRKVEAGNIAIFAGGVPQEVGDRLFGGCSHHYILDMDAPLPVLLLDLRKRTQIAALLAVGQYKYQSDYI